MNKRGQFFILVAVIVCLAVFVLVTEVNTYEEKKLLEDFPDLSKNYMKEAPKVVNDVILNPLSGATPEKTLEDFTKNFTNYAQSIDPNVGIVYVYKKLEETNPEFTVANFLNENDITEVCGDTSANTCFDSLFSDYTKSISEISLNIGKMEFKKSVPIKVTNFDENLNNANVLEGSFYLQIGGIFYPIKSGENLQIIVKSISGDTTTVSTTV